ncbi:MAG: AAA family ATPase [Pelagibacterales bacterium]|nr:AAA family ATPase [Pelagibacterales bacterium]
MSSKQDNHDKSTTPKNKKKNMKKNRKKNRKKNQSGDDEEQPEEKFDQEQFQKMLANMFPSKHSREKVNEIERKKKPRSGKKNKVVKKPVVEDSDDDDEYNPDNDILTTSDSELDRIFEEELEYHDAMNTEDEEELDEMKKGFQGMKFNIIFTGNGGLDEDYDEEETDSDEEETEEDEIIYNGDVSAEEAEDIKMSKKEYALHKKEEKKSKKGEAKFKKNERILVQLDDWDKKYKGIIKRCICIRGKKDMKKEHFYDVKLEESDDEDYETVKHVPEKQISLIGGAKKKENKYEYNKLVDEMKELMDAKREGGTVFEKKFEKMRKAAEEEEKKTREKETKNKKQKNFKIFRKLLRGKKSITDIKYFKSLDLDTQENIMKKMKEVQNYSNEEKPHKFKLIESNIPVQYKSYAMRKLDSLQWMDPGSGEYYKIKQWVDNFMKIPFGKYSGLPVTLDDGVDKCREFMDNAKTILDDAVYGLDDAKMQIMQLVGQWISNPKSTGTAIAIKGPMGTGKTTLVKEGVSKILNRPFSFVALGGATDSSFLEGHSYTYEGSIWGRIVDTLINCGSMNPVFYFDELDKVSQTPKGEEIIGILTHLTDTSQNDKYHDKYFSNIDFDLSKALFIFSYNDESKINPILKDRMYRISTEGYKKNQKGIIAQQYLIPKIIKEVNFKKEDIIIPKETIEYICDNLVEEEKGVRNLKRALEIIYTKINLYRLTDKNSNLFDNEKHIEIKLPFTVTPEIVQKLVKKNDDNQIPFGMYV